MTEPRWAISRSILHSSWSWPSQLYKGKIFGHHEAPKVSSYNIWELQWNMGRHPRCCSCGCRFCGLPGCSLASFSPMFLFCCLGGPFIFYGIGGGWGTGGIWGRGGTQQQLAFSNVPYLVLYFVRKDCHQTCLIGNLVTVIYGHFLCWRFQWHFRNKANLGVYFAYLRVKK